MYSLNVDQGTALRRLAAMFCDGTHSDLSSILLIHGKHSHCQVNFWSLHGNVEHIVMFGVWYMFNASSKIRGVKKYLCMDNPAYVTMFFRKSGRDVGDTSNVMSVLSRHLVTLQACLVLARAFCCL